MYHSPSAIPRICSVNQLENTLRHLPEPSNEIPDNSPTILNIENHHYSTTIVHGSSNFPMEPLASLCDPWASRPQGAWQRRRWWRCNLLGAFEDGSAQEDHGGTYLGAFSKNLAIENEDWLYDNTWLIILLPSWYIAQVSQNWSKLGSSPSTSGILRINNRIWWWTLGI